MIIQTQTNSNIRRIARNTQMTDLSTFSYDKPSPSTSYTPTDSFRPSSRNDGAAWKIAGMSVGMFSIPLAIASKSPALAIVGGVVGLALAFGSDR